MAITYTGTAMELARPDTSGAVYLLLALGIGLGAVWAVAMVAVALTLPHVPPLLLWASLLYPIYYTVLSFVLQARRARHAATT